MNEKCIELGLAALTTVTTVTLAWSTWKANSTLIRRDDQERAYHLAELRATGRSIWNRMRIFWADESFRPAFARPWIEEEEIKFERAGFMVGSISADDFLRLMDSIKFMREYLERSTGKQASIYFPGSAESLWKDHLSRIRALLPRAIGLDLQ